MATGLVAALPTTVGCSEPGVDVPPVKRPGFGHGVASGDPLPDAVILWTRFSAEEPAQVEWEVAKDIAFANITKRGAATANGDRDYTVKVDVTGLEPGTTYYYRFRAAGFTSPMGRTRTAPLDAKQLRFAVVSCASLPHGFFHVYRAIAERGDIDAVLHLGDYIYEYADGDYGDLRSSEPKDAVESLDDYRTRYAQYRRDADLQEAHRQHPFVATWDDHEFIDNAYKDGETGDNKDIGEWPARRSAAQRAYFEWMPVREQPDGRIWRNLRYGSLAELIFLDTRVWGRDKQVADVMDPALANPARQILGADQEAWLGEKLRGSTSKWKLVCQQVFLALSPLSALDAWNGYPGARDRFYDILEKSAVKDVIVLSGDVHSSWANELARNPNDPALYDRATGRGSLAVELVTPAITSPTTTTDDPPDVLVAKYGWIKFVNTEKRGYILLDVDEKRAHGAFLHIDSVTTSERGPMRFTAGVATYTGESRLRFEAFAPEPPANVPPLAPAPPAPPPGTAT